MAYTVKKISIVSGVTVRTLHFYEELGILKPAYVGSNGYRYYEEQEQYEAYRDNDDYYDQWDEPYSREYPITRRELAQLPVDMRSAFDPEYQEGLANFRAAAMQK